MQQQALKPSMATRGAPLVGMGQCWLPRAGRRQARVVLRHSCGPSVSECLDLADIAQQVAATPQASLSQLLLVLGDADSASSSQGGIYGFLAPLTNFMETVLKYLQQQLDALNVPYSYGYSIILLTIIVRLLLYPVTKSQVESSLAMQNLKPRIDNIKERYGDNQDAIQRETKLLYDEAGVNPAAGCIPALVTLPIFIGLYQSFRNFASEGLLTSQPFYWIPDLAGPDTLNQQIGGTGIAWLWPLVDGAPPVGWDAAGPYLVIPAALIIFQFASSQVLSPIDPNADNANIQYILLAVLPLMIGWFSLNFPAGLSLYYCSNIVLSTVLTYYLKKLGGASVEMVDLGPVEKLGMGRRSGRVLTSEEVEAVFSAGGVEDLPPNMFSNPFDMLGMGQAAQKKEKAAEEKVSKPQLKSLSELPVEHRIVRKPKQPSSVQGT